MSSPITKPARSPIVFVLLTVLIDTIGFGIILPVLPQLIMEVSQQSVSDATRIGGYLMLVFAALQFAFGPVMGNLSDAYGRRPVLILSLLAFGVNYCLMGLAPSLPWLFLGRALTGIAGAVYAPANAFIADVTPQEKRAQSFGLVGAAFGLGFVLGPALGGMLGEIGPRAPFFAASALALLNVIYGYFVLPESLPKERRRPFVLARANPLGTFRAFKGRPALLRLVACALFWQLAFQVYPSTWSFFVMAKFQLSPGMIGATLALSGLSMAFVQGVLTGRVVKRIGEHRAALLGVSVGMTWFVLYGIVPESWMLIPLLLTGGMMGVAMPSMNALMSREMGPERQGELQGGMASVMGLAAIVAPFTLTQTLAYFSAPHAPVHFPGAAFLLAACYAGVSLLLLLLQLRGGSLRRDQLGRARVSTPSPVSTEVA
jgi:DHA1 family tetracycline resistance protein-like MFS transporter